MRDLEAVRAFVSRDWRSLSQDKERYWASYKVENGPASGIRIASALRAQVRRARPDWPSAEERREDLDTHLRLIEVIRRAGRASR